MWQEGAASVLVTLVRTQGSSYRQPGARLLLGNHGGYAGTLSGGCLEAEVLRKATWSTRDGAVLQKYSTMFDSTDDIPFGLGCGGIVDLLLEPATTPEFRALLSAMERAIAGEESVVLTWFPEGRRTLERAIFSPDGKVLFSSESLTESVLNHAKASALYGLSPLSEDIFVERLVAPQRLVVLGAGDDAKPLVSMGALLGWTIQVMDGRPQLAKAERFPEAECVSVLHSPAFDLRGIKPNDAVVLMTHSYEQDRDLLATALPLRPSYLGILGARHRTSSLISDVAAKTGWSVEECCRQIQAPVGLNLGGDGPEVIALAVIAEIQACRTGQLANSRKLSREDVESYLQDGSAAHYRETTCALDTV